MRVARTVSLLAFALVSAVAVSNCAMQPAREMAAVTLAKRGVDIAFWTGHQSSLRYAAASATRHVAARAQHPPVATDLAFSNSHASIDADTTASTSVRASANSRVATGHAKAARWFSKEWYDQEQAEADRLTRLTHICRC